MVKRLIRCVLCVVSAFALSQPPVASMELKGQDLSYAHSQTQTQVVEQSSHVGASVARQSCENGGTITTALNMSALRAEIQKAAETMEVDALGRPMKFVMRGKTFTPAYENERLTGFMVDGKKVFLTAKIDSASPETAQVFYRDEDGRVKSVSSISEKMLLQSGTYLNPETHLTAALAKQYATNGIQSNVGAKHGGWDEGLILSQKPCYICDADFNVELGFCFGAAGIFAGGIVGAATAVCVASLGTACAFSSVAAILGLLLDYELAMMCVESARGRYISCRSKCG